MTKWEQNLRTAEDNENRDQLALEHKCRAAAKFLKFNEEQWSDLKGLIYHIDAGQLNALDIEQASPEYQESFRNYMMNR